MLVSLGIINKKGVPPDDKSKVEACQNALSIQQVRRLFLFIFTINRVNLHRSNDSIASHLHVKPIEKMHYL
jgi:hypothetical protein